MTSNFQPTQTRIPFIGQQRHPEVLRLEIQYRTSPTSSTEAIIEEDPTSLTTRMVFLSSTGEQILGEELEIPHEEEEEETHFDYPLIEESKELKNLILVLNNLSSMKKEKQRYTKSMVRKIGLEVIKEGKGVEEEDIKILFDFLFLMKIQRSQ